MDDSITSQNFKLQPVKSQNIESQNLNLKSQLKSENKILRVSFVGSMLFLLSECAAAFFTHSQAVLMDCVYDLVDLAMLGPFMILVPKLYKPVTERWPYGLAQIESLFIIIKCGLLLFLDIQLMADSVELILAGGHIVNAGAIAAFELFVSVSCITMYLLLGHMNKHFSSPTISAELYIWKLDAYSTGGVGLAFLIQLVIQTTPLAFIAPYIDPAIAIFMAIILVKEPVVMIKDALKSLILMGPDKDVIAHIKEETNESLKKFDFNMDFLDVVKTGRKVWVNVYIIPTGEMMNLKALKQAHDEIVAKLKAEYQDVFVELIPDIESAEPAI